MERELWSWIVGALKRFPRTRPRNAVYTDQQIVAVYLWAALHDRPVNWACERKHWPIQAWRRKLPSQSAMSRRVRHADVQDLLLMVLIALQHTWPGCEGEDEGEVLVADGKPLELSEYTRDPDARTGRGAGRYAKGYKLHLVLNAHSRKVVGFQTHPLNVAETTTAARILRRRRTPIVPGSLLLGDRLFDSNPLHKAAAQRGCQLIAPRKRPGTALGSGRHHPNRVESLRLTEGPERAVWDEVLAPLRTAIERFFGTLTASSGGLPGLPPWIRRLHRVRLWVAAKLVINAARIAATRAVAA